MNLKIFKFCRQTKVTSFIFTVSTKRKHECFARLSRTFRHSPNCFFANSHITFLDPWCLTKCSPQNIYRPWFWRAEIISEEKQSVANYFQLFLSITVTKDGSSVMMGSHHWRPQKFFQGVNLDILLILFMLLTMQCKCTFTKRFALSTP